MASFLQQPG